MTISRYMRETQWYLRLAVQATGPTQANAWNSMVSILFFHCTEF
jgi:hypothetical protein